MNLFNECFNTSRFMYNKGVSFINESYKQQYDAYKTKSLIGCIYMNSDKQCCNIIEENNFLCGIHKTKKIKWTLSLTLPSLRKAVMVNNKDLSEDQLWQKNTPYDTRQLSLQDVCTAFKSCITNKKNGNIDKFRVGFKSKKDKNQIFNVDKGALTDFKIFKSILKKNAKLRVHVKNLNYNNFTPSHNCKILKENNRYYILIPKTRLKKHIKPIHNAVALDPGVRTFQTYYSPSNVCGFIGSGLTDKLGRLNKRIDKLKSLKVSAKTKKNISKRCILLRTKIKCIVKDLHWQTCSFLVKTFGNIIIPRFKSQDMAKKDNRKINRKTTRHLLGLSHFSFLEKLKYKCDEYQRKLIIVTEEYTSKTCGWCGVLKHNLGGSKTFNCDGCNTVIDRDLNGARNILLKSLG